MGVQRTFGTVCFYIAPIGGDAVDACQIGHCPRWTAVHVFGGT